MRRLAQFSACRRHRNFTNQPARARARRYLHYIIDPAWEFAISSAGSYEDVIGIQMQRNMTKFDDLPGPADDALIVKVQRADVFFREFPALVTELDLEVRALEPLDASAAAVFHYLLGGARMSAESGA